MTIENFEKQVKEIFIQKGWDNHLVHWFVVEITAFYESKYVTVIRSSNREKFEGEGTDYEEAFARCISKIENS